MSRFAVGDRVRVHDLWPPTPPTHVRTPHYVRGHEGVVERICGAFGNPEELAFGRRDAPRETLYRVRFRQADLWPGYEGAAADHIEIEIYEFWLSAAGSEPESA